MEVAKKVLIEYFDKFDFDSELKEQAHAFLEGKLDKEEHEEFFEDLFDSYSYSYDVEFGPMYEALEKITDLEFCHRYLEIMARFARFHFWESLLEDVIRRAANNRELKVILTYLKKYNFSESDYLKTYILKNDDELDELYLNLDTIFDENEKFILDFYESTEKEVKAILIPYLISKDPKKFQKELAVLEELILEKVTKNIEPHVDLAELKKLIGADKFNSLSAESFIQKNSLSLHLYRISDNLKVATSLSKYSKFLNNLISFLVILEKNGVIDALYGRDFSDDDNVESLSEFLKKLNEDNNVSWTDLICWVTYRASQDRYYSVKFRKQLSLLAISNEEDILAALDKVNPTEEIELYRALWKVDKHKDKLPLVEQKLWTLISKRIGDWTSWTADQKEEFRAACFGETELSKFYPTSKKIFKDDYLLGDYLELHSVLREMDSVYSKNFLLFFIANKAERSARKSCVSYLRAEEHDLDTLATDLLALGIKPSDVEKIFFDLSQSINALEKHLANLLDQKKLSKTQLGLLAKTPVDVREHWLEYVLKNNLQVEEFVEAFLGDSSKSIKQILKKVILANQEKYESMILKTLEAKKQALRETALDFLLTWDKTEYRSALEKAFKIEKAQKLKNRLEEYLGLESELETSDSENGSSIVDYCKKKLGKSRKKLFVEFSELPTVRLKDQEETAPEEVIKYLQFSLMKENKIESDPEAQKILDQLNQQDLNEFSWVLLNKWFDANSPAKNKWVLYMATTYSDYRVTKELINKIKDWPLAARTAIACDAVKALAFSNSNEALMFLDQISAKFRFNKVKEVAGEAMTLAAKNAELSREELADKIVPTMGLENELIYDYGSRKFTASLTPELTMVITNEAGKELKNLPTIGKNDDQEKASQARESFKNFKKSLKDIVSMQSARLERALGASRNWTSFSWRELFVKNPIMNQFAVGLIWGVYDNENKLTQSFRYMDDGTFNTVEEEEYTLDDQAKIRLVHPLELTDEEKSDWLEQLSDYEIHQPFSQLDRKIFKLEEEITEKNQVEYFGGMEIPGGRITNKLRDFGWERGYIGDGGGYTSMIKNVGDVKFIIYFDYLTIGIEYEEDTTVFVLDIKGTPSKAGFSEVMLELEKAIGEPKSMNEKWKRDYRQVYKWDSE